MVMINDEYRNHHVFSELKSYIEFYDMLSSLIFGFCKTGITSICNIDSYIFSSIKGTLESIRDILVNGRINDSYALLRKYHDSAIINIYSNLYLEDHVSIENFIVEKIDNWFKGKDQLPEFRIMSSYIQNSDKVSSITKLLNSDDRYKKIRNRCNDHTHYNFFYNVLLNDSGIYLNNRLKLLNTFSSDLRNIFILHLAYLFTLNDHYMASSDYIDALECGVTPEMDSRYWVAPFIQEVFDNIVAKHRPDITLAIKQYTSMHLE
jgi:hypothetical protein